MLNGMYVFLVGMLVSFLGTLPLGSLNVASMQIATRENVRAGMKFAFGAAMVEIIYLRLSLKGMDWVLRHHTLFVFFSWGTVVMLLALSAASFAAAFRTQHQRNVLLNNGMNRFLLGITMSAINPMQIPFWFGWSTYLMSNNILLPTTLQFNLFTCGVGSGTICGLGAFVYGGTYMVRKLNANHKRLDIIIACIFLVTALVQLFKLLYTRPA